MSVRPHRRGCSRVQPQQPRGVVVVHLPQDAVGQAEAVDPPAALRRHRRRRVVEVLVLGLEEAEVDLGRARSPNTCCGVSSPCGTASVPNRIRSWCVSKNARAVRGWRPSSPMRAPRCPRAGSGTASAARTPRPRFSALSPTCTATNVRARVPRDDAVERVHELLERREVAAVERPVRVVVQLLEALVEAVDRQEERLGIGDVDRNRHASSDAHASHIGSKRAIVHLDERARRPVLAQVRGRASSAPSARAHRLAAPAPSSSAWNAPKPGSLQAAPARLGERQEAAGNLAVEAARSSSVSPWPNPPVRFTIVRTLRPVHDGQELSVRAMKHHGLADRDAGPLAGREPEVRVHVDDGKARPRHSVAATWSMLRGWNSERSSRSPGRCAAAWVASSALEGPAPAGSLTPTPPSAAAPRPSPARHSRRVTSFIVPPSGGRRRRPARHERRA